MTKECEEITSRLFPNIRPSKKEAAPNRQAEHPVCHLGKPRAEFVPSLGGKENVAVNVDRIAADEGILFTRCTAGSFRTDRGLVCLLSGYLGQPTTSVIRYTRKTP